MEDTGAMLKEHVVRAVHALGPKAVALSDELAANPEPGEKEFNSSRKHVELLREAGFKVEYPFAGIPTAFLGIKGKGAAKVALIVEYDALPGIGHACGHNVSGAMSTLAGLALGKVSAELDGEIQVIGTPAEETNGAKVAMAEMGVFDDLDLALMLHCGGGVSFVRFQCLAVDALEFTFTGRAAHASSSPWSGRNALNGVQLFFHAIDMLRQHVPPDVRMHGVVTSGGEAPNVVPDHGTAKFYFRAPKRPMVEEIVRKAKNCARGAAMATETEVSWESVETSFDEMTPNEPAEKVMEEILEELGVAPSEGPGPLGSSDIGNVSRRCPALQPVLAITERPVELHTGEFADVTTSVEAHEALLTGAKALALMALKTFSDKDMRMALKKAHRKALGLEA